MNSYEKAKNALLYFLALFKKQASGRFDYATKFNRKIAVDMVIKLPVTEDGNINFAFMDNFVQAQKKLAIKDVVDWKDKIIVMTKRVI